MFKKAIPLWTEQGLNTHLVFRAGADCAGESVLRIAAADFYKLYIDGAMVGFGPARTAGGYARVDEYPLPAGKHTLIVEVAGYHCSSLSTVLQDSFFAAELLTDDQPVLYTGRDFDCYRNARRVKRVERYSVQRHFGEVYQEGFNEQFTEKYRVNTVKVGGEIVFIPRRVPFADLSVSSLEQFAARGSFRPAKEPKGRQNAYSFAVDREPDWGYFPEEEIEHKPFRYIGAQQLTTTGLAGSLPVGIRAGEWVMLDFGRVEVGFLQLTATAHADTQLILAFCELCPDDHFELSAMNAQTVVQYNIKAGTALNAETFEPYSFRKAAIFVAEGEVTLHRFGMRAYMRDMSGMIRRSFRDPELNEIYEGAVRTFAHNAVDLFTDCPSRERAGWLCDSYFTGRAEHFFFGETPIEDAFLENYVLYRNKGEFPAGVLPMCYPSDPHSHNKFIPQWDLWYVLEVCEYLTRRNPGKDPEIFRPSVMGIMQFMQAYENEEGLLERLPSWNFVEWSRANEWTQDVNSPTNFLYAQALEQVGRVFGVAENQAKADRLRAAAIRRFFNGEVFLDNAVRSEQGVLQNAGHASEAGQYYAALFGGFDLNREEFCRFKAHIVDGFTGFRQNSGGIDFDPADAFIGLYLRMNVLQEMGDSELLARNLKDFFGGMCRLTGTLWEYKTPSRSLDHGFASYAALTLPLADSPIRSRRRT